MSEENTDFCLFEQDRRSIQAKINSMATEIRVSFVSVSTFVPLQAEQHAKSYSCPAVHRGYTIFVQRLNPEHELEDFLGVDFVETSTQLLLGLFDGDADPRYAALADETVDGAVKWSLFQVVARLAWASGFDRYSELKISSARAAFFCSSACLACCTTCK